MSTPHIPRIPRSPVAEIADRRWSEWARHQDLVEQADANTGTIDPRLGAMLRGAARVGELASEPVHYRRGYVEGHRHGGWRGLLAGTVVGALMVLGALQLGLRVGGL